MPCKEMIELEASFHRYTERRRLDIATKQERRQGLADRFRAGEARLAFIVLSHRQKCNLCRT
jgi:hypothetical protein